MGVDVLGVDVMGVYYTAPIPWENGSEQGQERMFSSPTLFNIYIDGSCLILWSKSRVGLILKKISDLHLFIIPNIIQINQRALKT